MSRDQKKNGAKLQWVAPDGGAGSSAGGWHGKDEDLNRPNAATNFSYPKIVANSSTVSWTQT